MGTSRLAVGRWIAVWVTLSVSIILTNKYVLGYTAFRFPFVLALWHMLLASATARTALKVLDFPDTISQHGSRTLNMQLAAIGVLFGYALVLGNASFIFLSVPTVQMLKVR
jgi:urea transporter